MGNVSLRDMAIKLQKNMYNQEHYITDDHVDSLIVRFHLRFNQLKSIYPCKNSKMSKKICTDLSASHIDGLKYQMIIWMYPFAILIKCSAQHSMMKNRIYAHV